VTVNGPSPTPTIAGRAAPQREQGLSFENLYLTSISDPNFQKLNMLWGSSYLSLDNLDLTQISRP
jgi:hypothetical protein